ncbi:nuclear transport factor 2 family protein [Aurantibacter crassamenti]|uniref:nuclear transport factor 2 family protein n=1 Tax=Aurantibacter crassamenti TaxID=1837375 RepID=UPI00193A3044|nr:nuclear transport factor 2 family protein [Aurantibacter crassamenti]MBM1107432.1 nuclear transport factor 2 family protein [Aurantibacter crassamenti]
MKNHLLIISLFICFQISAQTDEKLEVQRIIDNFFIGFHAQDSIKMRSVVADEMVLQTIINSPDGSYKVKTDEFSSFLVSISKIPSTLKFEENLIDYNIQIDGPMANVWTKYEFKINGELHHCGVNSFQLLNDGSGWKIIYLIDTRREDNCN